MRPHRRATVADSLRQRIISGDFAPGTRLSEESLAKAENVSRNTLREAFRVLQEQRLVEHLPNRGVFVASPRRSDVADIYRVRRWIETRALATASVDHPQIDAMRLAVLDAESALRRGDWQAVGTANMVFHAAIVALADSPRLIRLFRDLSAELRLAFLELKSPEDLHGPFVPRNRALLATFEAAGGAAAAAELDAYLADSLAYLLTTLG